MGNNSNSAFEKLIDFLGGGNDKIIGFMGIWGYFDASGGQGGIDKKGNPSPSALIAGYYASGRKWKKFNKDWICFLKRRGLTHLHTTDVFVGSGECAGWSEAKKKEVIREAIKIICKYVKYGNAQIVDYAGYKKVEHLIPSSKEIFRSDYFFCFNSIIEAGAEWARKENYQKINYILEVEDAHKEHQVLEAHSRVSKDPIKQKALRLGSIGFVAKKDAYPLQAADLLANLFYKETYRQMYEIANEPFTREELSMLVQEIPGSYEITHDDGIVFKLKEHIDYKEDVL